MKRSLSTGDLVEVGSSDFKRKKSDAATITTEREQPSEQLASKSIGIFGLNGDVLRHIFSFCSVVDLYAMATSSDQSLTLILETGIRGRMFDFGEFVDCCHILDVFKMFGKQMTKIKIGEKDVQYKQRTLSKLDEIFRLISMYCSVDTLKYLDLQYFHGTSIKKCYMDVILPFFRAIESFKINETESYGNYHGVNRTINELVERVIGNARNITSISMCRLKVSGNFFHSDHVRTLKNLEITYCNLREPDGFISFLNNEPKLKSFAWDNSTLFGMDSATSHSSNIVYELVANNVPGLEHFVYDQNEDYINDRNQLESYGLFLWPDYELLRNFKNLKVLRLPTMVLDCLKLLAQMNTVEKLAANLPSDVDEADLNFLDGFSNLKSIRFHTYESNSRFIYLSKLSQLTECEITVSVTYPTFENVFVKAVESAKNLKILRIHSNSDHCVVIVDFYAKLLEARLAHGFSAKPLVVYLNKNFLKKGFVSRLGQGYRPDVIEIRRYNSLIPFFSSF